MSYDVRYPTPRLKRYFDEFMQKNIPHKNQSKKIVDEVDSLRGNPGLFHKKGFMEIKPPMPVSYHLAKYRLRIGDYRVLYNVDDKRKIVWILDVRARERENL